EIADDQAVLRAQEEGVIAPSGVRERLAHLLPDALMRGDVVGEPLGAHVEQEAAAVRAAGGGGGQQAGEIGRRHHCSSSSGAPAAHRRGSGGNLCCRTAARNARFHLESFQPLVSGQITIRLAPPTLPSPTTERSVPKEPPCPPPPHFPPRSPVTSRSSRSRSPAGPTATPAPASR